ncbi:GTP-binding SAR1b [Brachionus plicatilis]|uniref:small monomeric GTPase n=1 Tax=Brachionus plicatilis TaxID=10195 RepID=A0A3M7R6M9_BRAPC|nr:GTP-binding SAR1b [Brachionus plicatilis]
MLKDNIFIQHSPTHYPTSEELIMGNIRLTCFDLGGHKQARRVWRDYYQVVNAIVFLIDVTDPQFFNESKSELDSLLLDEQVKNCPVLILGNKIDKNGALHEYYIRQIFSLNEITTGKGNVPKSELSARPIELFMCSIKEREGYGEAFRWLSQYL